MFKFFVLFISIFNFCLGLIVLRSQYGNRNIKRSFACFSSVTAWWVFVNFMTGVSQNEFWIRSMYATGALVLATGLIWVIFLIKHSITKKGFLFILLLGVFFYSLSYWNHFIINKIDIIYLGGFKGSIGPLFSLYTIYTTGVLLYIIVRLFIACKQSKGFERTKFIYVLIGACIFALTSLIVSFILPALFNILYFLPLDTLSSGIFLIFIIYAIIRYRLMNIRFAITRSLLFSILVTIIGTAITFGLILINKLINIKSTSSALIANFFIAIVIVLGFNPLKNKLAKLTDAIFFKNQTDPQEILRIIGTAVARDLKLEELLIEFSDLFKNLIKLKKVQILIGNIRGGGFSIFNPSNNHTPSMSPPWQRGDNKRHTPSVSPSWQEGDINSQLSKDYQIIIDYFSQNPEIKVTEEEERRAQDLKDGPKKTELAAIVKALNNVDVELAIPVSLEIKSKSDEAPVKDQKAKRLVNAIILTGAKINGEIFDNRDIKLFSLLAAQFATALEKSKLYERVKHFNLELKKKIQIATQKLAQVNIELSASNKELKQLDKAKSLFLSIAAHQLRTPLTGIKGYISMFLEGDFGPLEPKQIEIMKGVFSSSNRLTRLINTFLNVSRIEAGRLRLDKTPVDLKELCQTVITDLKEIADDKNLKLELDAPEKLDQILLDKDKIEDVLINLTDNAIKYTQTGKITLRLRQLNGKIRVEVQDTGIGISKKEADGLFNKFVRGKKALKMHTDGAGLGLFIVKKLIEAHDGVVGVENAGSGHGSIFWFEVPIEDEAKLKAQN